MVSSTNPAKDGSVVLQEATSKNGNKYQTSVPKTVEANKTGFAVDVNWPPSENWVDLPADLASKVHITRYKLVKNPPPPPDQATWYFEWSFWFTNTDTYDFFFED